MTEDERRLRERWATHPCCGHGMVPNAQCLGCDWRRILSILDTTRSSLYDREADLASLAKLINSWCREFHIPEPHDTSLHSLRMAIGNMGQTIHRAKHAEPDRPYGMRQGVYPQKHCVVNTSIDGAALLQDIMKAIQGALRVSTEEKPS